MFSNRHFLIVGGTKGIGAAISDALLQHGAKVTISGRTSPITAATNREFIPADLATFKGSLDLARKLEGSDVDTAVFTTGIFSSNKLQRSPDGVELDLAVSYMSRFLIARHIAQHADQFPKLKRVFIYGFPGQAMAPTSIDDINFDTTPYKQMPAHFNTVVMNECLVYTLKTRAPQLQVYGVNPGLIVTDIRDNVHGGRSGWTGWFMEKMIAAFTPTAAQYVDRVVIPKLLAKSDDELPASPASFSKTCELAPAKGWAAVEANRERAWEVSEQLADKVLLAAGKQ